MRRITPLLFTLLILTGCKSTTGPLATKQRPQAPDPLYNSNGQEVRRTSEQQEAWIRNRYPLLQDNAHVAPYSYTDRYGPSYSPW